MAVKLIGATGSALDSASLRFNKDGNSVSANSVVAFNRASNVVTQATSTTDSQSANCYLGLHNSDSAVAAGTAVIDIIPFAKGQLLEFDCTNNTADSQLYARCRLTNGTTLDNQADRTTSSDVFEIVKIIGAATNKKVWARFIGNVGQVAA